jgi:hypothetical protein
MHVPAGTLPSLGVPPLDASDPAVRVAQPDIKDARSIFEFLREEKSPDACVVAMDAILKPNLRGEKLFRSKPEQRFDTGAC